MVPRWKKNLLILCIGQFLVMAAMSSISPFLPLYIQELGVTDPKQVSLWAGMIFAANFLTAFIFSPFWGKLADKYGRKMMIVRSGIGMAITITLMGFVTSPIQLLLLRLLNGTIAGFMPAAITLTSTNTPRDKLGYALGILQAGGVSGAILGPLLGGFMADTFGFRAIFSYTGIVIFIATMLVIFLVKEKFEKKENEVKTSYHADFKKITAQKPILTLFSVTTMVQIAMLGTLPMIAIFVQDLSPSAENIAFLAGVTMAVMGLANMLASPLLGKLGDKIGAEHILLVSVISAAVFMLPQAYVTELWQLVILRFLIGLSLGGMLPSINSLIRQFAPVGMESRTYGYSNSALFLGNLLGPILAGVLASQFGIRSIFIAAFILLFVNAIWIKWKLIPHIPGREEKKKKEQVKSV